MISRRATILLIALSAITAISNWAIYTWPIRSFGGVGYWSLANISMNVAAFSFLLLPIFSAIAFIGKKYWLCYISLSLFPISAFLFGLTPVPFAQLLYTSSVELNNILIIMVNLAFIVLVVYLSRANKSNNYAPATPNTLKHAGF